MVQYLLIATKQRNGLKWKVSVCWLTLFDQLPETFMSAGRTGLTIFTQTEMLQRSSESNQPI